MRAPSKTRHISCSSIKSSEDMSYTDYQSLRSLLERMPARTFSFLSLVRNTLHHFLAKSLNQSDSFFLCTCTLRNFIVSKGFIGLRIKYKCAIFLTPSWKSKTIMEYLLLLLWGIAFYYNIQLILGIILCDKSDKIYLWRKTKIHDAGQKKYTLINS